MKRFLTVFLILITVASALTAATVFAETTEGWVLDDDGVERYYVDGDFVTGIQEINGFWYEFDDDGVLKNVYDAHTSVGTANLPCNSRYESELAALGKENIFGYYTFDSGETYKSTSYTSGNQWTVGDQNSNLTLETARGDVYTKNSVFTSVRNTAYLNVVQRYSTNKIVMRSDIGGGNAIEVRSTVTGGEGYIHTYLNPFCDDASAGDELVIEAEIKLGEHYDFEASLFQIIDRNNAEINGNVFMNLMNINENGGVYCSNKDAELVCVLNRNAYTRISVAIHPATNTYDIYVNGLLVKTDETYVSAGAAYTAANLEVDEVRMARFDKVGSGSMFVDNIAIYKASKPVYTITAEPKNGVYQEGGVIRYYTNNLISLGSKTVNGQFGPINFNGESVYFGDLSGTGAYEFGNTATVKVGGAVISSEALGGNVFIAPDSMDLGNKAFGGWKITDGDKVTVVSPGQYYFMNGDITCEPYEIGFRMLDGASVRTTPGSTGLRFMARLNINEYESLIDAGIKVEPHIMIVPTAYLDKTYGYVTIDALKKAGFKDMIDIKATEWYRSAEGYYYYTGSVSNILPENYMLEYSGIAYLKLTYPNGSTHLEYAEYDESVNSRSVYYVAHAAYNDRITNGGNPGYSYGVETNSVKSFSPYDSERLSVIKEFADRVIMLETENGGVKTAGDFYDAPYSVSGRYNTTTKKTEVTVSPGSGWSVSNAFGVVLDGESISDYTMSDKCVFSVETDGVEFSSLVVGAGEMDSWYFMDASADYSKFSKGTLNTNSAYCYEGGADSAKWNFKDGNKFIATANKMQNVGSYTPGYSTAIGDWCYDFSDIKSISFAIYCTKDEQTLQFNLHSENPETDGIDYYGKKLKLSEGWNKFVLAASDFSPARTPMGWDIITAIEITKYGWDQENSDQTTVYFTDIMAHNTLDSDRPFAVGKLNNAAVFAIGGYYCGVNGQKYRAGEDYSSVVFEQDEVIYLPIGGVADAKGMEGEYFPSNGTLYASYNGKEYIFKAGSKTYTVDGVKKNLRYAAQAKGDAVFFSTEDVMALFGYTQRYVDRMGLVVLSNTANIYDHDRNYDAIYNLIEECIYVRPSGEQIVSDLNEHSGGQHPYLTIDSEGFDRLRFYSKMDPTMQGYIASLEDAYGIGSAEYNDAPNTYRLTDGLRLLAVSRDVMNKTIRWALLAKLYEYSDPARAKLYAERCWTEIEAACNFKNPNTGKYSWHPEIFLDTSELAYPVAICYDWLYDYWVSTDNDLDRSQYTYSDGTTRRSLMEDTLYWMALAVTSTLPSDTTGRYDSGNYSLTGATNNWNGVCNGGMMAAALAICNVERYSDNVKVHLDENIVGIERGMWVYAPDGGYEEGPGYWSYGTTYAQVFMSCLDTACGTDYGVYNAPGFARSVYFSTYMGSKDTTWGFHDGGSGSADTNVAPWFAKKSNDPNVNAIRRQALENGWKIPSMYDVMYFDPHLMTDIITLDLDAYYSLDATMTFRSNWNPNGSIMAGLHGGSNNASHGDLDIGNFVINVNGTFLIGDLGSEAYNTAGYFGNYRFSYYRKRAEGQNTLVMLPSAENADDNGWNGKTGIPVITDDKSNTAGSTDKPVNDQIRGAVSKGLRYESGENGAIGIVDMAVAYQQMTEGKRGMLFTDERSTIVVQDEAVFSEDMDIWWFAHTEGNIKVSEDGRSAIITRGSVILYAEIVTDMAASAKFTVMAAESLDENYVGDTTPSDYYNDEVERSRDSFTKLCVRVDDTDELRLAVAFKVISSADDIPEFGTIYSWKSMDEWVID